MKTRVIAFSALLFVAVPAFAATLCGGSSPSVAIDQASGSRVATTSEAIRYSSAWESNAAGAVAEVAVDGAVIKSATGSGSFEWTPTRNGTYTLTHVVKVDGVQVGETLSATFVVTGFPEETQTTEVPVPFVWLKAKYPELTDAASMEAKANELAANGVNTVWKCYVIGLEPTAADAKFEAAIEMVDGVPMVTWSPDLGAERVYRVLGAKGLGGATARGEPGTGLGGAAPEAGGGTEWEVVTEETKGDYRFFKVVVGMP